MEKEATSSVECVEKKEIVDDVISSSDVNQPEQTDVSEEKTEVEQNQDEKPGSSWGTWGWGMLETAKAKSFSVLEAVRKDLDELSTVVKSEASAASEALGLNQAESTVGVMKKSISTFLGQVTDVLVPTVEDEEAEAIMITKDGTVTLSGFAKHLAELQANDATYLQTPVDELAPQYKRWLEVVEQDQFTEPRLTKQLTNSQILNEKYLNLVPEKISHMEFWKRYLFKKALLEDAVANAEVATKKAEAEANSTEPTVPEKIIVQTEQPKPKPLTEEEELQQWEDDICAANVELSEEQQAKLLEEYEKEIRERDAPKRGVNKKPDTKPSNNKKSAQEKGKSTNNNSKATKSQSGNKSGSSGTTNTATNKGKQNSGKSQTAAIKSVKKEELSSTSDESWEKDFEELDGQ